MKSLRIVAATALLSLGLYGCAEAKQGEEKIVPGQEAQQGIVAGQQGGELRVQGQVVKKPEKPNTAGANWLFIAKGNRQCEGGGMTLSESRRRLESAGVKVLESRCGVRTDMAYIQVCGGATGDILLHHVEPSSLEKAVAAGYRPAGAIRFEFGECRHQEARPPRNPRDQT